MRNIKFRFWHIDDQKYYYHMNSGLYLMLQGYMNNVESTLKVKTVFPQQFTGLLDKNKKEVFIGDIVKHDYEREEPGYGIGIIDWDDMYCGVAITKSNKFFGSGLLNHFAEPDFEVIGNIFENPELIEN